MAHIRAGGAGHDEGKDTRVCVEGVEGRRRAHRCVEYVACLSYCLLFFFSLSLSVFLIHTLTRSPSVHIMPWSYTCPPEFLFEGNNRGVLSDQSVESVALKLVSEAKGRAAYTIHGSHVMWLWGMHIYRRDICSSSLTAFSLSPTRSRLSL